MKFSFNVKQVVWVAGCALTYRRYRHFVALKEDLEKVNVDVNVHFKFHFYVRQSWHHTGDSNFKVQVNFMKIITLTFTGSIPTQNLGTSHNAGHAPTKGHASRLALVCRWCGLSYGGGAPVCRSLFAPGARGTRGGVQLLHDVNARSTVLYP